MTVESGPGSTPPPHTLGADLCWWRETGDTHTLLSILWSRHAHYGVDIRLVFRLYDAGRELVSEWARAPRDGEAVIIDSKHPPPELSDAPPTDDGVLAVFAVPSEPPSTSLLERYERLYSLVDWYTDDGRICCLHNDQSFLLRSPEHEFTEIVVEETDALESALVIVNGPLAYPANTIELEIENHRRERRRATYEPSLASFSVHKVRIRDLIPEAVAFAEGRPLAVTGRHTARGLYIRPYVVTTGGASLSAYHGGDRYPDMVTSPAFEHRFLERGRVNPFFAIHTPELTTTINLFNSHGTLDDDFWVDLYLYDESGTLVTEQRRWRLARRGTVTCAHLVDVLPDGVERVVGHVVLAFSHDDKPAYPGVLQALAEYRSPVSTARIMMWSDEWNSPKRAARRGTVPYRAFYRAWFRDPYVTEVCISNCANEASYQDTAPFTAYLLNERGERQQFTGTVPPHGTVVRAVTDMFPEGRAFVGETGIGVVVIESDYDLAEIQLTRHARSGAVAAEHFMAMPSLHDGKEYSPAGS